MIFLCVCVCVNACIDFKNALQELTRIINANNPHAAQNIARYSFKDRAFKAMPNIDHLIVHFEYDG